MPANVQTYVGRQAAWHGLGTVVGKYSTWAEILQHGGLDFDVFKSQLHDGLGRKVPAWGTFRWDLKDKKENAVEKAMFLGVVGESYKVINHACGFELIDAIMATQDGAHYETAGVLGNGEVVWGLADLALTVKVRDDEQKGYLLFCTSHDGSYSYWLRISLTRVVCQNTLNIALSEKGRASFRIRHTKSAMERVNSAHQALQTISADMKTVEEKLNFLATRRMTRESMITIFDRLFPKRKKEDGETPVNETRRENMIADVLALYENNDHNTYREGRGSAYNLLNAVTEYTDHFRGGTDSTTRNQSSLFGSGDKLKNTAMDIITEQAKTLPAFSSLQSVPLEDSGLQVRQ